MKMDRRQAKKLIAEIQAVGGVFSKTERSFKIEIENPTQALDDQFRERVGAAYGLIPEILWPRPKRTGQKRVPCKICPAGSGCRWRRPSLKKREKWRAAHGGQLEPESWNAEPKEKICSHCQHSCRCHYPVTRGLDQSGQMIEDLLPGYCQKWPLDMTTRCPCPGWPQEQEQPKKRSKRSEDANMGLLISDAELERSREKYQHQQAELHAGDPKSKKQVLIEVLTESPGAYTVRELAEGSSMSLTWVRRTLKVAGLSAMVKAARVNR